MKNNLRKVEKIFQKGKTYLEREINKLSVKNNMITVDCLKDDNQITVEFERGDTVFEFTRLGNKDKFILTWSKFDED